MKSAIKYIKAIAILFAMLLPFANKVSAQDVVLDKHLIGPAADGSYTIKLEAFVTGSSEATVTDAQPLDVVLVLDVSGSMGRSLQKPVVDPYAKITSGTLSTNTNYVVEVNGKPYFLHYHRKNNDNLDSGNHSTGWYIYESCNYTWNNPTSTISSFTDRGTRVSTAANPTISSLGYNVYSIRHTRMQALKASAKAFIDLVNSKTTSTLTNKISIVQFSSSSNTYTKIVKDLTLVDNAGATSLKSSIDGLSANGATMASTGMSLANTVFSSIPADRDSKRVIVFFTDGSPTSGSNFENDVADGAISAAKTAKDNGATVFSIGLLENPANNVNTFMHRVSSNYPNATSMTVAGSDYDESRGYYQNSDGADLSDIFSSIASSIVSSDVYELTASTATVIDVMSSNFQLPAGMTGDMVSCYTVPCDGYDSVNKVYTFDEDNHEAVSVTVTVTKDAESTKNNVVKVTGYDFSKDDVDHGDNTVTYGNWVGPRKRGIQTFYKGRKLVMEFKVVVDPDYEGGYVVPSNKANSGIYVTKNGEDIMVKPFPVPGGDFPSICIWKTGLDLGETAIFKVVATDTTGVEFNVALTQRESKNHDLLPCFVVLKNLPGNYNYKVTETNWSWTYTTTASTPVEQYLTDLKTVNLAKDELKGDTATEFKYGDVTWGKYKDVTYNGKSIRYALIMSDDDDDLSTAAVTILFMFDNQHKDNLPKHAEAAVHNSFKGGTAGTGGMVPGGEDPEENL